MRKLAAAAFSFSVAVFVSRYFLPYEWLPLFAAVTAVISLAGLFFYGNVRKRIFISLLSLSLGFLWFFIFTSFFVNPYLKYHDESKTVTATVTDFPVSREPRGYRVDVSYRSNGHPSAGVRLYYYNEVSLKPGDTVEFTAKFRRTDITDEGDRFDALSGRGLFLSANVSGDIKITETDNSLRFLPKMVAEKIANKIDEIFPDDISPFMQALLLGKRDELYKDSTLTSSLSASGIIHIVSVSGMHISFLMGFFALIIGNKRLFSFYGIPILLFFMAMTGFTPAVTRAGIMQIFLITAPLFRRERDSITSLSAALFVLLASNPYSCASVGLHLSFFATFGIILFTSRINGAVSDSLRGNKQFRKKAPRMIIKFISSNLATTIGASIFTIPLTAVHFGYVSLVAPITNLLTMGAVSFAFPFGLIAASFGFISSLSGIIAAYPVTFAARYIIGTAGTFASVPYCVVYSSNAHIIFWLAYVYVIFTVLPAFKARLRQYIYPCCISIMLLFAIIFVSTIIPVSAAENTSVTVVDVGQGMSVVISANNNTILIDCGSNSSGNAGEVVHEFLLNQGKTSVDLLVITHFHADHINGIEFLLSRIAVSAIAISDPDGSFLAEDIIKLARKRGTDIIYINETYNISFGELMLFIYPPLGLGDENERGLSVLLTGDITALITGDMSSSAERTLLRFAALPKLDLLVVGHHGSRHSTCDELLSALLPDIAVIPVGKNSFGHPSPEVIDRLNRIGADIYRTDEHGNITVYGG